MYDWGQECVLSLTLAMGQFHQTIWRQMQKFFCTYRVSHEFGQAKFPDGGLALGSSPISILPQLPQKMMLTSKGVKIDSKISHHSRCSSKSVTHSVSFSISLRQQHLAKLWQNCGKTVAKIWQEICKCCNVNQGKLTPF